MIDDFLDAIKHRKPATACWITDFYGREFFLTIFSMLQKMGLQDGEYYTLEPRKKKLRLSIYSKEINSISYHCTEKYPQGNVSTPVEDNGRYIILSCWYDVKNPRPGFEQNWREINSFEINTLSDLYNYLRIEYKKGSLKKSKYREE